MDLCADTEVAGVVEVAEVVDAVVGDGCVAGGAADLADADVRVDLLAGAEVPRGLMPLLLFGVVFVSAVDGVGQELLVLSSQIFFAGGWDSCFFSFLFSIASRLGCFGVVLDLSH